MVSLEQRQALAALSEADPHLKRLQLLLDGQSLSVSGSEGGGVREALLSAISSNDSAGFKETATKIGQRKTSAESDWCQDDYLLFLLLLGNQKFGRPLAFLPNVIEAHRQNQNPVPQKINHVFAALERQEFGIEGEFAFLKVPFLHLLGKLRLGPIEARKALDALSAPGLLDQMSPFLKLLTRKAYDLVLIERQPLATETTAQLIEAFEAHAKDFSLRHWWRVVGALPGRLIVALILAVAGLGLIPILIGVGKGLVESHKTEIARSRPTSIEVSAVHDPSPDLRPEVLLLAKAISHPSALSTNRSLLVEVQTAPFVSATSPFVVEASHPEKPIKSAIAFTEAANEGLRPFTIVPLEHDGARIRAILPEQAAGQRLCLILEFEANPSEDVQTVGKRVILRPLQ